MNIEWGTFALNIGVFIATAGAAATAWWQAIEASHARDDAREAERAALRAWQEAATALIRANDISGYSMRTPFANELHDMATYLLGARVAGAGPAELRDIVTKRVHKLVELRFAAGDVPTDAILKWASRYPREADVGVTDAGLDFERWSAAGHLISDRIRLWLRDPAAGDRAVRDDPRVDDFDS